MHLTVGLFLIVTWKKGKRKNETGRNKNDHRTEKHTLEEEEKKTWKNCNGRESQKEQEGEIKTKKDIKERKN